MLLEGSAVGRGAHAVAAARQLAARAAVLAASGCRGPVLGTLGRDPRTRSPTRGTTATTCAIPCRAAEGTSPRPPSWPTIGSGGHTGRVASRPSTGRPSAATWTSAARTGSSSGGASPPDTRSRPRPCGRWSSSPRAWMRLGSWFIGHALSGFADVVTEANGGLIPGVKPGLGPGEQRRRGRLLPRRVSPGPVAGQLAFREAPDRSRRQPRRSAFRLRAARGRRCGGKRGGRRRCRSAGEGSCRAGRGRSRSVSSTRAVLAPDQDVCQSA